MKPVVSKQRRKKEKHRQRREEVMRARACLYSCRGRQRDTGGGIPLPRFNISSLFGSKYV